MGRLASVRWGRPGVLAARRAAVAAAPAPGISGRSLKRFCGRSKPENSSRLMPSGRALVGDAARRVCWVCTTFAGGAAQELYVQLDYSYLYGHNMQSCTRVVQHCTTYIVNIAYILYNIVQLAAL